MLKGNQMQQSFCDNKDVWSSDNMMEICLWQILQFKKAVKQIQSRAEGCAKDKLNPSGSFMFGEYDLLLRATQTDNQEQQPPNTTELKN